MPGIALPDWVQDYADQRVFVCWGYRKTKSGTWTKPPLLPSGAKASSDDPATWVCLEDALRAIKDPPETIDLKPLHGVGIMLTNNAHLVAFDLDHCYDDEADKLAPWAHDVVAKLSTYCEVTPSRKGIRAIGTVPAGWHAPIHRDVVMDANGGHMEIFYNCRRFITLSGDLLPGAPEEPADVAQAATEIIKQLLPQGEKVPGPSVATAGIELPVHIDELRDVVGRISPEVGRKEWVDVALALKWEGGDDAKRLFLDWSFSSERWGEENRAGAAEDAWESAAPDGRANFGKLVYLAKTYPAGAGAKPDNYCRIKRELLSSSTYRSLPMGAKLLLVELHYRYNGQNNGSIRLSWEEAQALLGCGRRMVAYYFAKLRDAGLVEVAVRGSAHRSACNLYRLTCI